MSDLPAKPVPQLTDAELATVIHDHEDSQNSTLQDIVKSCWLEIERRHGLTDTD